MLTGKLTLHDVRDVEAFTGSIVEQSRLELDYHAREDLAAYLVATCWELSVGFEPGGISFSTYASKTLRRRVFDWVRRDRGRTRWHVRGTVYERPLPQFLSLDDPDRNPLAGTVGAGAGDPAADRDPDLGGLFRAGDRGRTRDLETLGLSPPRRAS